VRPVTATNHRHWEKEKEEEEEEEDQEGSTLFVSTAAAFAAWLLAFAANGPRRLVAEQRVRQTRRPLLANYAHEAISSNYYITYTKHTVLFPQLHLFSSHLSR
jgi:hypothetical protein